jgi:copper chaperone CopZ
MIATYAMLGLPLAIIRPVVALVTGVVGGIFGNRVDKNGPVETQEKLNGGEDHERSVKELFRYGFVELLQDISKWLIIGMLVAALLSVLIPTDFFANQISNEYLAMLIMLAASVPLYICATGSIPIAAVLLMKGLSPGAALVLLMAGPATNFATMAVIGNAMGKRTLWVYLMTIIGGALLFGTLINEFVPRDWIMGSLPSGIMDAVHEHPSHWFQWVSSGLLVLLIINGYVLKYRTRAKSKKESLIKKEQMTKQIHTFRVEGMTCNHCKASVENGLGKLDVVSGAVADPEKNMVTIEADGLSEAAVQETVEGLGYTFKGKVYNF